jgi:asparagine synthase (glutamine-hydrolysing)
MCGINGFIGKSVDKIEIMNNITNHRGPDNSSFNIIELANFNLSLGHNRLSIIDLSISANQPFISEDNRYSMVYNGELYNYIELKKELENQNIIFQTNSDTEVVFNSLIAWGVEAFKKFNGMWGIAFFDKSKNELILSRDRFGEKPLYYCVEDNNLYFSSEIKAILEVSNKKKINKLTLNRYLLNGSLDSTEETFFENIYKVPASSYSIINLSQKINSINFEKFWDINDLPEKTETNERKTINYFREIFNDSVKIRLRSDVNVGTLLSGGLDSSTITYEMSKNINNLDILSAVSSDEKYSEEKFIDIVSNSVKVNPRKVNLDDNPKQIFDLMEKVIWHNDEPIPSFSVIAHYLLMEESHKNNIKVILSGQGADELLGGYQKYYIYYILELLKSKKYFGFIKELLNYLFNSGLIKQFSLKEANRYLPSFLKKKIRKIDFREESLIKLDSKVEKLNKIVNVKERQIMDLMKYSVPALTHYEDRMSMAFSREIRLPFLDYRLVEYIISLPLSYKMRHGWTKWILRKAFEGDLPDTIIWRKDKKGFTTPQEKWFRKDLKDEIEILFNEDLLVEKFGLMNKSKIKQFYQEFLINDKIWYKEVFNIISVEIWLRINNKYLSE